MIFECPQCHATYDTENPAASIINDRGGPEPWHNCGTGGYAGVYLRRAGSPLSSWRKKMLRVKGANEGR